MINHFGKEIRGDTKMYANTTYDSSTALLCKTSNSDLYIEVSVSS